MNREEILRMAREQGLPETEVEGVFRVNSDDLGRLLAAEREASAKLIESRKNGANELIDLVRDMEAQAIRARSEQ